MKKVTNYRISSKLIKACIDLDDSISKMVLEIKKDNKYIEFRKDLHDFVSSPQYKVCCARDMISFTEKFIWDYDEPLKRLSTYKRSIIEKNCDAVYRLLKEDMSMLFQDRYEIFMSLLTELEYFDTGLRKRMGNLEKKKRLQHLFDLIDTALFMDYSEFMHSSLTKKGSSLLASLHYNARLVMKDSKNIEECFNAGKEVDTFLYFLKQVQYFCSLLAIPLIFVKGVDTKLSNGCIALSDNG